MKKQNKELSLNIPFDVEYTIRFTGRSQADGVKTMTSQMVRDKIIYLLDEMVKDGHIRDYQVSVVKNNIKEAEATIRKSKQE